MYNILIIEDHQDIFENLERKILVKYPNSKIIVATNCDDGLKLLLQYKMINPFSIIILDLTFATANKHSNLKTGRDFIRAKNKNNLNTPILVYSSHDSLLHIEPTIELGINGYVIKTHNSSGELLIAMDRVLNNEKYFSQKVHELILQSVQFKHKLDKTDLLIIKYITQINFTEEWKGKIPSKQGFMSYKSIKVRIDKIIHKFEVENEKQLVLKLNNLNLL